MKTNKLSISQLKQSLKKSDWKTFISQFNAVHNKHLSSNVGNVEIKINDKKKINNK
jgi:hypothetical protein